MKFYLQVITTVFLLLYTSVESLTMEEATNNPNCTCTNGRCICARTQITRRRFNSTANARNLDANYELGNFETDNAGDPPTPAPTEPPPDPEPTQPPPDPEPVEPPPDATGPEPPPNTYPNVFVTRWSENGKTYTFGMSLNGGGGSGNENFQPSPANIRIATGSQGNGLNSGFSGSWTTFGNGVSGGGSNFETNMTPGGATAIGIATAGTGNMPVNGQNFEFNNGQNFGLNNGQNFEFNNGQNFGLNNGQNFEFNNGQNFGLNNGQNFEFNNGQNFENNNGKNFGFNNGQSFGFNNGQSFGFNNGQNLGFNSGQNLGFNNGQSFGLNNGQNLGFNNGQSFGFNEGQNFGLNNGFSGATAVASSNTNGGSLMSKMLKNFNFGIVKPFDMNLNLNGFKMPMQQQQSFFTGMIPFKTPALPLKAVPADGPPPQNTEELDDFR